jgi:putative transposase
VSHADPASVADSSRGASLSATLEEPPGEGDDHLVALNVCAVEREAAARAHADGLLACDFLAVETARVRVVSALFFIQVCTRRVVLAGCTVHPTAAWVTQQARNVADARGEAGVRPAVLLRDRDATFPPAFDGVFAAQGTRVVRTPVLAPRAKAFAERWVGTARRDRPDWLQHLGLCHLERVLREYVGHDNRARPHRALKGTAPAPAGSRRAACRA